MKSLIEKLFAKRKDDRCESCRRGFNGRNGNGYQPCGCPRKDKEGS